MWVHSLHGNREISCLAASAVLERSASGRRGVEADEARAGEVRPLHSSTEAGEQTWATGRGAGGAKGEDRGEHGRATHVPDTAPGKRVPEARLCTRSCLWVSSLTTRSGSPVRNVVFPFMWCWARKPLA